MILLIVHCLTDSKLKQLYKYAHKLGLEVLVEVHSIKELQRAHQLNASLIGINNRDLTTFNTHVEHTNQILRQNILADSTFLKVVSIREKTCYQ